MARVWQEWGLSRSTFYAQSGRRVSPPREQAKRGPKTLSTDEVLTAHIRQVLGTSPFLGEGHRKAWAWLRAHRCDQHGDGGGRSRHCIHRQWIIVRLKGSASMR
ncbi:MAG: hypothetical protein WBK08_16140 [Nitrospira sp.]